MKILKLRYWLMLPANIRELALKALIGGALIAALPAMILLILGAKLIYPERKYTLRISGVFLELSKGE
jgi:hypothetical protein